MITRAACCALLLVIATVGAVKADDFGSRRGVREIRGALPVLVQFRLNDFRHGETASVDDVFVDGDDAIADWHSKGGRGIAVLHYRNARWWLTGNAYETQRDEQTLWATESVDPYACAMSIVPLLDARYLRDGFHASDATVALWSAHAVAPTPTPGTTIIAAVPAFCFERALGTTARQNLTLKNVDGYRARWWTPSGWSADVLRPISRAPTDAEMSVPGADALFFFSATVGANSVTIEKTTLDVWCPFVLDPEARYSLAITGGDAIVGPLDGAMANNVLHFDIPAFTSKPGAYLQGEIDWLRKRPAN